MPNPAYSSLGGVDLPTAYVTLQVTVNTSAVQLTATPTPVKTQPQVKADPANLGVVYVIVAAGTTSTGYPLAAGEVALVPVDDLSKVWLIATTAAQKAAALAGV